MIRLPVSGRALQLALPDGADDVALLEAAGSATAAASGLIDRLLAPAPAAGLCLTDFEWLLLALRQRLVGPIVRSHCVCPSCASRVDISFAVADYAAAIRPACPPAVTRGADGMFAIGGAAFRLPTVADRLAVEDAPRPGPALRDLCIGPGLPAAARRRCAACIARMAPEVSGPVGGVCPECEAGITALFDVTGFVLAELRRLAATVTSDIHALAGAYGWAEAAILALPAARRRQYAALIRGVDLHRTDLAA